MNKHVEAQGTVRGTTPQGNGTDPHSVRRSTVITNNKIRLSTFVNLLRRKIQWDYGKWSDVLFCFVPARERHSPVPRML